MTDTVFIMKIFLRCYKIYSVRTFKWCMHKELKTSTASMICSPKQIVTLSNFLKIHRLFQHPETLIFQDLWGSAMYLVGRKTFVCLSIALVSKNMVFLILWTSNTGEKPKRLEISNLTIFPCNQYPFSQIYWSGIHDLYHSEKHASKDLPSQLCESKLPSDV